MYKICTLYCAVRLNVYVILLYITSDNYQNRIFIIVIWSLQIQFAKTQASQDENTSLGTVVDSVTNIHDYLVTTKNFFTENTVFHYKNVWLSDRVYTTFGVKIWIWIWFF
jgi:hypothetical protein